MGPEYTIEQLFDILRSEYGRYIEMENDGQIAYIKIVRNPDEPGCWTCAFADNETVRLHGHNIPWKEITDDDIVAIKAFVFEWLIDAGVASDQIYKYTDFGGTIDPNMIQYLPGVSMTIFDQMRSMPNYVIKNRAYLSRFFSRTEILQTTRFLEKMCRVNPNQLLQDNK